MDLSKFVEMHQFSFDCTLDEGVTNDQVYRSTVQPLVATLFRGGKATCFAYGQARLSLDLPSCTQASHAPFAELWLHLTQQPAACGRHRGAAPRLPASAVQMSQL